MTLAKVTGVVVLISVTAEAMMSPGGDNICNEILVSTASAGTAPSGQSSLSLKDFSPSESASRKKF